MEEPDMSSAQAGKPAQKKPFRLWPGVVIVVLQWLLRFVIPVVIPEDTAIAVGVLAGMGGGVLIGLWWAFFSRAPWKEGWGAVLLVITALAGTRFMVHDSIGSGLAGLMFFIYAIPFLSLVFVVWAVACSRLSDKPRRVTMVLAILFGCGVWMVLRSDGLAGGVNADFAFRWTQSSEEALLAKPDEEPMTLPPVLPAMEAGADWPGFRGANRDDIIRGVKIKTDWSSSPPVEMWRRPIGPGCSSFAVRGGLLYTQEQRGEDEIVSCYYAATGKPAWRHADTARFYDSHAGAGPRSTPTLSNGRVYTLGATGILNVLNARDSTVVWSRNAASDTDTKVPTWAFASSPLVLDDIVIVAVEGILAAYDLATGDHRWSGPEGGAGYSSPHLMTIDGVEQVLLMSGTGAVSVTPADGRCSGNTRGRVTPVLCSRP